MRAMAVAAYGEALIPIDVPEPDVPNGYALLEVLTCGVCFSDVKTSRGEMPFSADLSLPHIPGHEICGRVIVTEPPGLLDEGTVGIVFHYWRAVAARVAAEATRYCVRTSSGGSDSPTRVASASGSRCPSNG